MSENDKQSKALWGGRFKTASNDAMVNIGQSITYDRKLYYEDILGSLAHVTMLSKQGILTAGDAADVARGLKQVAAEIEAGDFTYDITREDIHMHIEARLTDIIGDAGRRLHTARSRNDQVSVDVHLHLKRRIEEQAAGLEQVLRRLLELSEQHHDTVMPGYTHLQVAQPVRCSHYFLAWFWKFLRDNDKLTAAYRSADVLTLGSGAFAGVNYNTDRELLAAVLNFGSISENSMDAVSERDYQHDYLYFAASLYTHISRFCEECILYSSVEFGFFTMDDSISTGSSIMPQKKNPDLAELLRGKSARVISALNRAFLLIKNLPLTYNRDLQEDKENLFDSLDQVDLALAGLVALLNGITVNAHKMTASLERGYATATDLADALVAEKGVPFRDAHDITGRLVGLLSEEGLTLAGAPKELRAGVDPRLEDDDFYMKAIDLTASCDKKVSRGGTASSSVNEQRGQAESRLKESLAGFQAIRRTVPAVEELADQLLK